MSCNARSAMEDLDGAHRDPHPHGLAQERVRYGVVMPLDLDVIIEADLARLPFCIDVRLDRQRLKRGPLDLVEQCTPARSQMPRHASIELCGELADGSVDLGEREEALMAQLGDDPSRCNLYCHLDLGFIAWLSWTCRHDGGVVVNRHLCIGSVHRRLVEACF